MMTVFESSTVVPTRYWQRLSEKQVQCNLCPRACQLREGQRGLCFVRANQGGQVVLTTYGRSSGFCVDPIEKKPFYHFLPGTPILSFGTAGCNLACRFCQNWNMSKSKTMDRLAEYATPAMIAQTAQQLGCHSIAYTYNDPVIFHEYAIDVAQAAHQLGIRSVAVTAGYMNPEPRIEFFRNMDAANVDLKAFSEQFYYRLTGGHLQPVLDTLCYLKQETSVWLEITTLLIPGENDSVAEISAMTQWIVEHLGTTVPLHFTAFHPSFKLLDKPRTPLHTLTTAREIAIKQGIHYVYTGNVYDLIGSHTYCHHCGHLLIGRTGYDLNQWQINELGQCSHCNTVCSGVFTPHPGHWGTKRLPVRF